MIRPILVLVIFCVSLPGVAASVLSYNAEHQYQKDKVLPFADFSLILTGVKTNTFQVGGVTRQNATEQFEIRLPDGRKIRRELTNGFPGGVNDVFQFRASRLRFFSVRALNGILTVRETDQVAEKSPDGSGFLRFQRVKIGDAFQTGSGTVYVFPAFDVTVGSVRSENKTVQLSPSDIEAWYRSARAAYETAPYDSAATKELMMKSLERSRAEMEKNPRSTVVLRYAALRFTPESGGKVVETELPLFEAGNRQIAIDGRFWLVSSQPAADSGHPDQLRVTIVQK